MKFIECTCSNCNLSYKITFDEDISEFSLYCPVCGCNDIQYHKIDPNGF